MQCYSAEDAIGLIAEVAVELVDIILIDAPPSTVGGLAVEAVLRATLCNAQAQLQKPLVLLLCEQLTKELQQNYRLHISPG